MTELYLDNAATTRVLPEAAEAFCQMATRDYGNPSSVHSKGTRAERMMQEARGRIAASLGGKAEELTFLAGATEGNNLAVLSFTRGTVVTTAVEHPSILGAVSALEQSGSRVVRVRPGEDGVVRVDDLLDAVDDETSLVAVGAVNSETGAMLDVMTLGAALKRRFPSVHLHIDAVQGYLKQDMLYGTVSADSVTITGHKIHAPKGIGALWLRRGRTLRPRLYGGGQERGLRSGTESTPLIQSLAAAVGVLAPTVAQRGAAVLARNQRLRDGAGRLGLPINSPDFASPYILNLSVPGIPSEVMMQYLDERGIFVSNGSACHRGGVSEALLMQGLSQEMARSALRISFCHDNTPEDIDRLLEGIEGGMKAIRVRKR